MWGAGCATFVERPRDHRRKPDPMPDEAADRRQVQRRVFAPFGRSDFLRASAAVLGCRSCLASVRGISLSLLRQGRRADFLALFPAALQAPGSYAPAMPDGLLRSRIYTSSVLGNRASKGRMQPMPIVASLVKVAALAMALLCASSVGTGLLRADTEDAPNKMPARSEAVTARATADAKSSRLQCRIYFGCMPVARVAAGTAQQ
jgi:hypothetical protein